MIGTTFYFPWEVTLMVFLQSFLQPIGSLISAFSFFGGGVFLFAILGLFYFCIDKEFGKTLSITVGMGILFNTLIKNFFVRRRPYFDHSNIQCLSLAESDYHMYDVMGQGFSCPSAHAVISSTLLVSMAVYIRKYWFTLLAIALILLTGLSRVYIGVHYPTDVILGWVLAIITIGFIYLINSKIEKSEIRYLIFIIISLVGLLFCQSADYFRAVGLLISVTSAFLIEEKYIHFKNTRNIKRIIIRLLGGIFVFVLVLFPLTLVFPHGSNIVAYLFRGIAHGMAFFVSMGLYPFVFKKFDKFFTE